ncbi:MAG: hypothetical protein OWU84_12060 [Firmicutes bacterium]|nr:hypothetical protein [Bacillota bacterium]
MDWLVGWADVWIALALRAWPPALVPAVTYRGRRLRRGDPPP